MKTEKFTKVTISEKEFMEKLGLIGEFCTINCDLVFDTAGNSSHNVIIELLDEYI